MFSFDKRTLIIVLLVMLALNILSGGLSIEKIILSLPGVIVAMTFHEFAHAWMATKLGDDTPRLQGRLTLNPMDHIDPVGLIFLIIFRFGWGKPVQINSRNFDGKYSLSKAEAMVAAAGPVMNFILAFIFTLIYMIMVVTIAPVTRTIEIIETIISSIVIVNLGLGVFNLIPVYPLDGSKILNPFLPLKAREWMARNEFTLTIVLLIIVYFTNIISSISFMILNGMERLAALIIGLFI